MAFHSAKHRLTLEASHAIWLSSNADGTAWLSTDDFVQLRGSNGRTWEWDFRNAAHTEIVPIPPQDITHLFAPGDNTVELTLTDLTAPEFSSWPYYLVVYRCPAPPTPTATATATTTPSPTPTPTATATPTMTPTATATATPVPTVTATSTSTPSPVPTATATVTPSPSATLTEKSVPLVETSAEVPEAGWPVWPFIFGSFTLLAGGGLWMLSHSGPRLVGELEVQRNGRFVYKQPLTSKRRLSIGAKGDILLASEEVPDIVAHIYAEQGMDGEIEVYLDRLQDADGVVAESITLYHGSQVRLADGYSIKYINPTSEWYTEGDYYA